MKRRWHRAMMVIALSATSACELAARLRGGNASPVSPAPATSPGSTSPASATSSQSPAPQGAAVDPDLARNAAMPGEDATDIPDRFVRLVRDSYTYEKPTPATPTIVARVQGEVAQTRNNNYKRLRPAVVAFEKRWAAYSARKREVDRVLASAEALEKAGKLGDALAALDASIPQAPKGGGSARASLEARDAETPALQALARIAIAARNVDVPALPVLLRVAAGLWTRRPAGDHDTELLLWLNGDKTAYIAKWEGSDVAILKARREAPERLSAGIRSARELLAQSGEKAVAELVGKQAGSPAQWPALFDDAAALASTFAQTWRPYVERRQAASAAIAEAATAEQAGKLADAHAKLAAAITSAEPNAQRGWIEPRDAELAAIEALARVAKAESDWRAFVVDVTAAMWSRRRIGSADAELAAFIVRGTQAYNANDPASGKALAKHRLGNLGDEGLVFKPALAEPKAKRGTWIVLTLPTKDVVGTKSITFSGRSLRFKLVLETRDEHCTKTNRIDRVESDGYVRYQYDCTYTPRKVTYTVDAALAEAAPAWASALAKAAGTKDDHIEVVGRLAADGGPIRWKLQDARVLDLRFTRSTP